MATFEAVRSVIAERYQNVREVSAGVFKGELVHQGKPYAVAFWDLSDSIVERSADLKHFQEGLVGPEFFSADGDLRWNNYLFFLAGPRSVASDDFLNAPVSWSAIRKSLALRMPRIKLFSRSMIVGRPAPAAIAT